MWKTVVKWSALGLLLAYVVVMFVWGNAQAALHTCKGIEVDIRTDSQGAPITEASVIEVLSQYPAKIQGAPLNSVNSLEIADFLRKFNNFESVECALTSQGKLRVRVRPMIPEIRVFDKNGSYYVNKDGKTMTANHNFYVDVPVVSGNFNDHFKPGAILPWVRYIQNDEFLSSLTAMIIAEDADDILLVPRVSGHIINLGDTTRMDEKRRAILTAYRQILPYRGWETYDTISVKFKGQIAATRRDKKPLYPTLQIVDEVDLEESAAETAAQAMENRSNGTEE